MSLEVLWIDDKPKEGAVHRSCLDKLDIRVDVANSVVEAKHRIDRTNYGLIFLRPDLQIVGSEQIDFELNARRQKEMPFPYCKELLRYIRDSELNRVVQVTLLTYFKEYSHKARLLRSRDIPSDSVKTLYDESGGSYASQYACDVKRFLLKRELKKSRVGGGRRKLVEALRTHDRERYESRVDG